MTPAPEPIAYRYWWPTMPRKGESWTLRGEFDELSERSLTEQLTAIRCRGEVAEGEIAVISVLRNEAARLPLFFDHYKKLGVGRFFMVDNDSDDGSHEILLAEPLADVFHTAAPYKHGQMGVYWYNGLARAYCRGRWTITADADELFVYDAMERHNLHDLVRFLQSKKHDRLLSTLIDVYPSQALGHDTASISELLEFDCWFDDDGYTPYSTVAWRLLTGGPRHRLFNQGRDVHLHWLSKYPLIHMSEDKTIFDAHYIWPYDELADRPPYGALIHLKLMHDFIARSRQNELEGQHVADSRAYRIINDSLARNPDTVVFYGKSKRYRGPKSLVRHHMMAPIAWPRQR